MSNLNSTIIYRYIGFQRFVDLLFNKELTLVSPSEWPDEYELYWLKLLESPDGVKQLQHYIGTFLPQQHHAQTQNDILELCRLTYSSAYCLCFSKEKDSEVMWNAHSDNRQCIMFAVKQESLLKLLDANNIDSTVKEVQYDLTSTAIENSFFSQFKLYADNTVLWDKDDLLLKKRNIFSYEKEVRLIAYSHTAPKTNAGKKLLSIPIPDLSTFIEGVLVHPSAESSYVSLIALVCSQFKLNFWGKSSIYKFLEPHNKIL